MVHSVKRSIECWIFDKNLSRFLLLKCPETSRHKEYWQPVTGGIEHGEDNMTACLREIKEETGIVVEPDDVTLLLEGYRVYSDEKDLHKTIFLTQTTGLTVTLSDEHIDYTWADPSEVMTLLLWGSNRVTFQRVMDYLESH